jgi:tetratricopeptide (TPR) repeat protein
MFLILAGVAWFYRLAQTRVSTVRVLLLVVAAALSLFTWQRNSVWQNNITIWSDVVKKSPQLVRGNANLGIAYNEAKKYDLAESYLQKAVALGQADKSGNFSRQVRQQHLAKAHEGLAMIYREMKDYPRAIHEANLSIELAPSRPEPLLTLGIIYAKLDQHQRAYEYFRKAQANGIESVDLYNNWAVSSFNLGMTDMAIRLFKHSLLLDPEHPESHYNLGIAYSSKGMLEEAQREMNTAIELRKKALQTKQALY